MQHDSLFLSLALKAWADRTQRVQQLLATFPDELLLREVAPGKNRGIYLVGHLLAYHDDLSPLLGLGPRLHPELDAAFMHHPDRAGLPMASLAELRQYWPEVHDRLLAGMQQLPVAAWFERHAAVSEADFAQQPHRNKLSVLLSRTNHLAYHSGQLMLLQ
ncbi:DinB family protein [Hymenobacter daeguensis]